MAFPFCGGNSSSSKEKMEEEEEEEGVGLTETLVAVGVAAVALTALWGLSKLCEGSGEKKMKAPGKEYYIPRKDFDTDPAQWFRNNR